MTSDSASREGYDLDLFETISDLREKESRLRSRCREKDLEAERRFQPSEFVDEAMLCCEWTSFSDPPFLLKKRFFLRRLKI